MKSKTLSPENISIKKEKKVIIAIGSSAGGLDAIKNFLLRSPPPIKKCFCYYCSACSSFTKKYVGKNIK